MAIFYSASTVPWTQNKDFATNSSKKKDVYLPSLFLTYEWDGSDKIKSELKLVVTIPSGEEILHLPKNAYLYCYNKNFVVYCLPCILKADKVNGLGNLNGSVSCVIQDINNTSLTKANFVILREEKEYEYLENWLAFFDYLLNRNHKQNANDYNIVRFKNVPQYIAEFCGNDETFVRSMILEIIENTSTVLNRISTKIRKNLIHNRTEMRLEKINQLDARCLLNLLKLEGNTIREKAEKNKGKLLGINKQENYNLLENRVLKDFLYRCIDKCRIYQKNLENSLRAKETKIQSNSYIFNSVGIFKNKCDTLLKNNQLADVPRQTTLPTPNFVLQKDVNYKVIWKYYLALLNSKKEVESLINKQHNLFQDIIDLMINACLCTLATDNANNKNFSIRTICKSYLDISREQIEGHRVKLGSSAGPFIVDKKDSNSSYIVELINVGSKKYSYINKLLDNDFIAPTYLVFTPISSNDDSVEKKIRFIPIYSYHVLLNDEVFLSQLKRSIKYTKLISPLVIVSYHEGITFTDKLQNYHGINYISSNPKDWALFMTSLLATLRTFMGNLDEY